MSKNDLVPKPDHSAPAQEADALEPYIYPLDSNVFTVSGLDGMVGAVYARYSRARGGFKETFLKEFIKEGQLDPQRADVLIDRVLIAYGDDSVGELEGAHLSMEDVSNLATKEIEDRRIGLSPIEQSTRYVFYDQKDAGGNWRYHVPSALEPEDVGRYRQVLDTVFETYVSILERLVPMYESRKPLETAQYDVVGDGIQRQYRELSDENDQKAFRTTWRSDIRTKACDCVRALLPAATLTHVGMYGNGRAYQNLITHLRSHPLEEMTELGDKAKRALERKMARYVQRGGRNDFLVESRNRAESLAEEYLLEARSGSWENRVKLIDEKASRTGFQRRIATLLLYPHSNRTFASLAQAFDNAGETINKIVGARPTRRDKLPRAFETGYPLMFEFETDFGIYRDLERHRMLSQHRQLLATDLGFEWPPDLLEMFNDEVEVVLGEVESLQHDLARKYGRWVAQYPVLLGYRMRYLMEMNFREACHFIELRSGVQGHPGYRRIAQEMHRLLQENFPETLTGTLQHVNYEDVEWARATSEAKQRVKERKLEEKEDS